LCVPEDVDAAFIAQCSQRLARANVPGEVAFSCVQGGTAAACLEKLERGDAEIASFGASDAFLAHKRYGFSPIAMETYGDGALDAEGAEYYSVAVVSKSFCESAKPPTLAALKGKGACFTGYRRSAGWVLPVGELVSSGTMPLAREPDAAGVQDDAASVSAFFGKVCAPDVKVPDGPVKGGKPWAPLCELCAGDCSATDPYADYAGPIKCVLEGDGAVGFTKHTTAIEEAAKAGAAGDDLRLLCPGPEGGCKPLREFASCSMSRVPAHAIVASSDFAASPAALAARDALLGAADRSPTFLASLTELGGVKNAVFKKGTTGLVPVDGGAQSYFGQALSKYSGLDRLAELAASGGGAGGNTAASSSSSAAAPPAGWVSPGGAAGLAIGMAAAGALIGAGGMWLAGRRGRAAPAQGGFDAYASKGFVPSA
jgi:melanoma-associated antigen p97